MTQSKDREPLPQGDVGAVGGWITTEKWGGWMADAIKCMRLPGTEPEVQKQMIANVIEAHKKVGHRVIEEEIQVIRDHYNI